MTPTPPTAKAPVISAELETQLDELIARYPQKRSASVMVLHALQEHFGFITPPLLEWGAKKLGLEPLHLYELITFYPMFHEKPVGQYHLKICRTLSCALLGAYQLRDYLCSKLGLDPSRHGTQTTPDGRFTVEFVECLAACNQAPVLMCNDQLHTQVTHEKADALLNQHKKGSTSTAKA